MERNASPLDKCTDRARRVLARAYGLSVHHGHADIQPLDLLTALAHEGCVAAAALAEVEYVPAQLPSQLPQSDDTHVNASPAAQRLMSQARIEAAKLSHRYPGSEHQLLALTALHPELFEGPEAVRAEVLTILGHGSH